MDSLNVLVAQAMIEERQREVAAITNATSPIASHDKRGVRHALAATIVRLGLRLDPAAGEGLGHVAVRLARHEGGC